MRFMTDKVLRYCLALLLVIAAYCLVSAFYPPLKSIVVNLAPPSMLAPTSPTQRDSLLTASEATVQTRSSKRLNEERLTYAIYASPVSEDCVSYWIDSTHGVIPLALPDDSFQELLRGVFLGQTIELENEYGRIDYYRVEDISTLDTDLVDPQASEPGQWLVLYACQSSSGSAGAFQHRVLAEKLTQCNPHSCVI